MTSRTRIAVLAAAVVFAAGCSEEPNAAAGTVVGTATEIPGVIAAGSPIQRIVTDYKGLDDPIGLMDGSLVFSEPNAKRLHRLNTETDEASVLVADSNESHGVTQHADGHLISAQAWDGSTRIGVIYPPGSEA